MPGEVIPPVGVRCPILDSLCIYLCLRSPEASSTLSPSARLSVATRGSTVAAVVAAADSTAAGSSLSCNDFYCCIAFLRWRSVCCGLAVYFIAGFIFLKFVRGANGVEAIPQGEFWLSLPGLVKDGCVTSSSLSLSPLRVIETSFSHW